MFMDQHNGTDPKSKTNSDTTVDLSEPSSTLPARIDTQAAETEAILKGFQAEVASTPGFRGGAARAPGHYISAVEVTSWLQVPAILNQLQNEGVEKLRLIFPTPTANTFVNPEHIATFVKEQHQIANFIKENHSKPIEEIKQLLIEKIESSFSLGVLRSRPHVGDNVTAASWVEASLLSSDDSKSLGVSTLFPIGQKSVTAETTTDPLTLSLLESAVKDRPSTVTIPSTNQRKLEELAQLFSSLLRDGGRLHEHSDLLMSNTKVWVGPYVPRLNTTMEINAPCPDVKEYSLRDFIDTFLPKEQGSSPLRNEPTPTNGGEDSLALGADLDAPKDLPPSTDHDAPHHLSDKPEEGLGEPTAPPTSLDNGSTGTIGNSSSTSTDKDPSALPPADTDNDVRSPHLPLESSSLGDLVLTVERRVDARTPTSNPLEEATLPPRPNEVDVENCIREVKENPEEASEWSLRRRRRMLFEQEITERTSEHPEESSPDGGFA